MAENPTEMFLQRLVRRDCSGLLQCFAGEPSIDDPLAGRVRGAQDLQRFCEQRSAWLAERQARVEPVRTTHNEQRTVFEALLHLQLPERVIALPIAVVGERAGDGQVNAIRIYHSLWPLEGRHRVRAPLLLRDPQAHESGAVGEYQQALAAGNTEAIVKTFEPDGYFREPAGGEYVYRGEKELTTFMAHLFGDGGIQLEHCTVTDDGVACAIEFNAVRFGQQSLAPQAGVAVYQRGKSGKLHAARVYDDVNVEALAGEI